MNNQSDPRNLHQLAADPGTDYETLRDIAYRHPELRAVVAQNPHTYSGLLEWLGSLGDPAVDQALAQRRAYGQQGAGRFPPVSQAASGTAALDQASRQQGNRSGESDGSSQSRVGLVLGILIAIALVLVVISIVVFKGIFPSRPVDPSPAPAPQSSAQSTEPESNGAAEEQSEAEPEQAQSDEQPIVYPAPAGAVQAGEIMAPSGNIACTLSDETVSCVIVDDDYAAAGVESCGDRLTNLVATAEGASRECVESAQGGGQALEYGKFATSGDVACQSTQNGMSCWNMKSGASFALARQGWMVGEQGPIGEDQFRW